jgi:Fe-S-cluster containining protein
VSDRARDSRPTPEEAAAALVQLHAKVDAHALAATTRDAPAITCAAGCDRCCHARFGVFEVEAAQVRAALDALAQSDPPLRARVRAAADDPAHADRCALLHDGRCTVYAARPAICRSQGLALRVRDEPGGAARIDHCELNYRDRAPSPASVLNLDALERPLALIAQLWDGRGGRVALADLAREPDPSS